VKVGDLVAFKPERNDVWADKRGIVVWRFPPPDEALWSMAYVNEHGVVEELVIQKEDVYTVSRAQ